MSRQFDLNRLIGHPWGDEVDDDARLVEDASAEISKLRAQKADLLSALEGFLRCVRFEGYAGLTSIAVGDARISTARDAAEKARL